MCSTLKNQCQFEFKEVYFSSRHEHSRQLTPLHLAAKYGQLGICRLILDNADDKTPLRNDKWTPLHEVG